MTDSPFGPGRRDVLLIATGTYDDRALSALRSPGQDCTGLAEVLTDARIGGFDAEQLKDARAREAMRAVERFFLNRSRDDLLLLHISCHGIKDDDGHLYFAARDTDRDLPASTAIPAAFLRDRMERCRARTIVVLLDCCYSGAFLPGVKGDDQIHVRDELGGHGRAVLTATSRTEYAWEGERVESRVSQPSRFTGALIEGLATGAADLNGDGRITVTELYDYVYESLHRAGVRQRPRMWADLEYQVTIARAVGAGQRAGGTGAQPVQETPVPPRPEAPSAQDIPVPPRPQAPPSGETVNPRYRTFAEITDAYFGTPEPYPRPRSRTRRGQDALIRLELGLKETAFGADKEITVDTAAVCSACSGSGTANGTQAERCGDCGGQGETTESQQSFLGEVAIRVTCQTCEGYGTIPSHPCPDCGGDGRVRARRTLSVKVPAGVDNGARIQLAGEGEVGSRGGRAGDLYVEVMELPHPVFQRRGDDLHCTVTVPRAKATAGGTLHLETLDGRKTIRIPQGTRDGQTLRLANLGVIHLRGRGRGDLLVRVEVRD